MSDVHALSGAYAVDALDDLERTRFEKHLATCADCRAEVFSLREAAAALAEDTALTPPAALRDSVLAAAAQVRPLPPVVEPARPARRLLGRGAPTRFLVAIAAALLIVVGGSVVAWHPWRSAPVTLSATEQVLRAPDAKRVTVATGPTRATLVRSVSLGRAVLVASGMPAAPGGKVYELWLQRDGRMVPAGLMTGGSQGPRLLEGDAAKATAAGITVEPAGGSPEPTTPPIMLFDFSVAT